MSKPTKKPTKKSQSVSRPPVDALQYEKLALSAFDLCNRHLGQLDTLIKIAVSICRNPAITADERRAQQTLLALLINTGEQYQQELAGDRELYQVIALDAKGVAQSRLTASRAARLLEEAARTAQDPQTTAKTAEHKRAPEDVDGGVENGVEAEAPPPTIVLH
jgi:hypothetical protein